jgi:tRNA (guanine37-N1)-methyltransferase
MKFDVITLFPNTLEAILNESILKRAVQDQKIEVQVHDLRKWTTDARKTVDDKPFGGGPGMLMQLEPIYKALKEIGVYPTRPESCKVVLTSAGGLPWNQNLAQEYSIQLDRLVIIAGHYEGVDFRVVEHLIDAEISIGNYVLTGGELAAGVMIDSISRLIPGVLGNQESLQQESHTNMQKEYPQYTRPAEFITDENETWAVPEVLLSGNHAQIEKWRKQNQA